MVEYWDTHNINYNKIYLWVKLNHYKYTRQKIYYNRNLKKEHCNDIYSNDKYMLNILYNDVEEYISDKILFDKNKHSFENILSLTDNENNYLNLEFKYLFFQG